MRRKLRICTAGVRFTFFAALVAGASARAQMVNNLMPQPATLHPGQGALVLTAAFAASATGVHDERLAAAVMRTMERLEQRTGLHLATALGTGPSSALGLEVEQAGEAVQSLDEDESYKLDVTSRGVRLHAATVVGALHGLQTLEQLVQPAADHFILPAVSIEDKPRFAWRGLMIDCGRHFEPVPVLERMLDAMAAVKLNVFHWHLTDDQGFRIESKVFPKLTGVGSDGLFYTQQDAREIVEYARARGIRVVPEFEMPGHSTAWLVAYPELASGHTPQGIRREFGISDVALDPTREETYSFLERFLGEMVTLFPDPYLHIGGDETVSPDWKSDPRILAFMRAHNLKDSDALQAYFNQRVLAILTKLHKHMVGWDEILNPALPKDVVVQSWRGEASLAKGAQGGYQGILSAGYYLDGMRPAGEHYLVDPVPANTTLAPAQQLLILGGEICMWGEHVNATSIDSRVWPRSAAIAERLWSPQQVRDVNDMYRRLDQVSVEIEGLGLHHLSQEDSSLRTLAQSQDIDDLRVFASALEPVPFSDRYKQQETSQLTVLDRFVDAVRPDPPSRHRMELLTDRFMKNHGGDHEAASALTSQFHKWQACVPGAKAQIGTSPLLADVQPRTDQLATLSQLGIEAMDWISGGKPAPAAWVTRAQAVLDAARQPGGIVRFTFQESLARLVQAASGAPTSASMPNR